MMTDKSLWLTTAGMIALTMAMPAAAQETAAPQAAVDQDSSEIIVTATRRASCLRAG